VLCVAQVLRPVQAAVLFVRAEQEPLVEPLHFINLIAMQRGLLEDPCRQKADSSQDAPKANPSLPGTEVAVQG
jgi:hypothetical protein